MAEKTKYHVLREIKQSATADSAIVYAPVVANVEAGSAAEALRATVKEAGTYVAVPARSFTPTAVKIETQTLVKIGAS